MKGKTSRWRASRTQPTCPLPSGRGGSSFWRLVGDDSIARRIRMTLNTRGHILHGTFGGVVNVLGEAATRNQGATGDQLPAAVPA